MDTLLQHRYKKTSKNIVTILFLHKSPHFNLLFHIISSNIKALIISYKCFLYLCHRNLPPDVIALQHAIVMALTSKMILQMQKYVIGARSSTHYVLSMHFTNVMVNFNCFHTFNTEITNYRTYFTVCRVFNEQRHFKYVQTNVNTLECCRNGGCRLPTDVVIQCTCVRHRPQRCSGGILKRYLLKKISLVYIYEIFI